MLLPETLTRLDDEDLPALVYFDTILRDSVRAARTAIAGLPRHELFYSVKAAAFPFLLHALRRHGVDGFDASSPQEAAYVRSIVGPDVPVVVTAPAITKDDIGLLRRIHPKRVHADSIASLALLLQHAPDLALGLRINPGVGESAASGTNPGTAHCRLGVSLNDLSECLKRCAGAGVQDLSLHFHIACGVNSFSTHIVALSHLSDVLAVHTSSAPRIRCLDIGGGLRPLPWDFDHDELLITGPAGAPALWAAMARFVSRTQRWLTSDFAVWLEPGDALVSAAAALIARVSERRIAPDGTRYVIVNTNIHHFPTLMLDGEQPRVVWPPVTATGDEDVVIAGNSCRADDTIARLRAAAPFDRVVFDARGSYDYSRTSFFNGRLRPSVFFCHLDGHLTRERRDTLDDLHRFWSPQEAPVDRATPPSRTWFTVDDGQAFHYSGLRDAEISFPRSVAQTLIGSFTTPGDVVLDPFAGYGTAVVVAAEMGRIGIGIEMNPERQQIAGKRVPAPHRVILGDCNDITVLDTIGAVDMVLTSPPHWQERGDALRAYTTPSVAYPAYLAQFSATLRRIIALVRPFGTVVLVVQNITASRDQPGKPLVCDIGRIAAEQLWFEKDWIGCMSWQELDAAEFGNHSHCLIFSKREIV
jgi:diaminopimelate decarboxylase